MVALINELNLIPVGQTTRLELDGTVTTLTPPFGASQLLVHGDSDGTRLTVDGTDPLSLVGYEILQGMYLTLSVGTYARVKLSAQNATSSVIQYQWFKGAVR